MVAFWRDQVSPHMATRQGTGAHTRHEPQGTARRATPLSEERDGRERLPSIADRGPGQSVSESPGYDKPVKRRRQPKALR